MEKNLIYGEKNSVFDLRGYRGGVRITELLTAITFMCMARNLLASSMNGRFSCSDNNFHSAPRRLLISELCILGFSCAILRRCPLDHTMKAFIGRLTLSGAGAPFTPGPPGFPFCPFGEWWPSCGSLLLLRPWLTGTFMPWLLGGNVVCGGPCPFMDMSCSISEYSVLTTGGIPAWR